MSRNAPPLLFLTGDTAYGVLQRFAHDYADACSALGRSARVVDIGGAQGAQRLVEQLQQPASALIGVGGVGADLTIDGRLLYELARVPYVGLVGDSPAYQPARHRIANPYHALLLSDPDFLALSRELSPREALRGAYRLALRAPQGTPKPLEARANGLVYCKSAGRDREEAARWPSLPRAMRSVLEDVLAVACWNSERPVWELVRERIAADGVHGGSEQTMAFAFMVMSLDVVIRGRRARRFAEALLPFSEAVLIGDDWRELAGVTTRATIRPDCDYRTMLALADDARVVASLQPLTRHSPQERVIVGMQRGAVVVADTVDPLTTELGRTRFRPFSWSDDLSDVIRDALVTSPEAQAMATEAAAFARADRDLNAGARALLTTVDQLTALASISFAA